MSYFNLHDYLSNVVGLVNSLKARNSISKEDADSANFVADIALLSDAMQNPNADFLDKTFAAAIAVFGAIYIISEDVDNKKLAAVLDKALFGKIVGEIATLWKAIDGLVDDIENVKNNGEYAEKIAVITNAVLAIINDVAELVLPDIAKFAFRPLLITLQLFEVASAVWVMNTPSLIEKIQENIENIKSLHDEFSFKLETRSSSYINFYENAVQKASEISGLSVAELSGVLGGSLTVEEFIERIASEEITSFKDRLNRAEEFGLNESYDEAKAAVEMWIGEGTGDKGQFDALAETQITIWLKTVYQNALDKIQADILSDTHSDTLNTINAQLAGIIDGYSHIDEADKAAILAGWQQKFAGEFALERNGSDALLLDEIARLKAEMARLGTGEGTSILDMPNPAETLAALMEQQDAALTATMQDYLSGFLGDFTDYVAGVDERQQQRDDSQGGMDNTAFFAMDSLNDLTPEQKRDLGFYHDTSAEPGSFNDWYYNHQLFDSYITDKEYRESYAELVLPGVGSKAIYFDGDSFGVISKERVINGEYLLFRTSFHGSDFGDHVLTSSLGGNYIYGGVGDDYILARGENLEDGVLRGDWVESGAGNDTIESFNNSFHKVIAGAGDDFISLGDGNNYIIADNIAAGIGGDGNDFVHVGDGNNRVDLGGQDDSFFAGNGNNTITAGSGRDYIVVGDGNNSIIADGYWEPEIYEEILPDRDLGGGISVPQSKEYFNFNQDGLFYHAAFTADRSVYNDTIIAGNGRNVIYSGAGDDTIIAGDGGNLIHGDLPEASSFPNAVNPVSMPESYHGNDFITSGSGDDQISGGGGNDVINAGAGNDDIWGDMSDNDSISGDDIIDAGEGNDTVYAGGGNDVVYAGSGDDIVFAEDGDDRLYGGEGVDELIGGNGDDYLDGGQGNDFLFGEAGNDSLFGGDGDDHIYGDAGNDTLHGDSGKDLIVAGEGDDDVFGGEGNDVITGEQGNDKLDGGDNDDVILGGDGNDILIGGRGNDYLYGGTGNDTYIVTAGDGKDVIEDTEGQNSLSIRGATASNFKVSTIAGNVYMHYGNNELLVMSLSTVEKLVMVKFDDGTALNQSELQQLLESVDGVDMQQAASNLNELLRLDQTSTALNFFDGKLIAMGSSESLPDSSNPAAWIEAGAKPLSGAVRYFRDADGKVMAPVTDEYGEQHAPHGAVTEHLRASDGSERSFAASYIRPDNLPLNETPLEGLQGDTSGYNAENRILSGANLTGGSGNEVLRATTENSRLRGENGDDIVMGAEGNDALYGGQGNDILSGGRGDDWLEGSAGNDLYYYALGDGNDTISNSAASGDIDILQFGSGITPDNVTAQRSGSDLVLTIEQDGGRILLTGYFNEDARGSRTLDYIRFSDSDISWDVDYIRAAVLYGSDLGSSLTGYDDTDDILVAGTGDDILHGKAGNDVLDGGAGNDKLYGGAGNDTYLFGRGDGQDIIHNHDATDDANAQSHDRLVFKEGVALEDVEYYRSGADLVFSIAGSTDTVTVSGWFNSTGSYKLQSVDFSDGRSLSLAQVELDVRTHQGDANNNILRGAETDDFLYGYEGNDNLYGEAGNDRLYGGAGYDSLYGGSGNDVLIGGDGDDRLVGGAGSDEYHFERGWGQDSIDNYDPSSDKLDVLVFGEGIAPDDIEVRRESFGLRITLVGSSDSIWIDHYFTNDGHGPSKLEEIRFADGTVWDIEHIKLLVMRSGEGDDELRGYDTTDDVLNGYAGNDRLFGYAGNDFLDGGAGDDRLDGGDGDDILIGSAGEDYLEGDIGSDEYHFDRGWGWDTINNYDNSADKIDAIVFAEGIRPEDILVTHETGLSLRLTLAGSTDKIDISRYFAEDGYSANRLEEIRFADGTVWSIEDVKALALLGTSADDYLFAYSTGNTLNGGEGNDRLTGREGGDELYGGAGEDLLEGYGGNDLLYGDEGADKLWGGVGDDRLHGGMGNDFLDGGAGSDEYHFARGWGQDAINNYDTGSDKTDAIVFAEGITTEDIQVTRQGDHLLLSLADSTDRITVNDYFKNDGTSGYKLEEVRFANGTVWDIAHVKALAIEATDGNDDLYGYATDDVIRGGAGNDSIYSRDGDDELHGDAGDDSLGGGQGNDVLYGGDGNDYLNGDSGNDQLYGGTGNDTLYGGSGNDEYHFSRGWGQDVIQNFDSGADKTDAIVFAQGIKPEDVQIARDGENLILTLADTPDIITVEYYFQEDGTQYYSLEEIRFADGTVWDIAQVKNLMMNGTDGDDTLYGLAGDDVILAGAGDDVIDDISGNNQLFGEDGNDNITGTGLLDGGAGDDVLEGKDADTLRGGEGNDTLIAHSDTWRQNQNTLEGGKGNDTLYGGFGDDTYVFNLGDGTDTIIERRQGEAYSNVEASNDTLAFGEGIVTDDLTFIRSGSDLLIRHTNGSDSITVQNWFAGSAHYQLNLFSFADGSELSAEQVETMLVTLGTAGNDNLFGSASKDDVIYGEAGDDYIDGRAGDDTLYGGAGNDSLVGGPGNDLLIGGAGDDKYVYNPQTGQDTIDNSDGGVDGIFFTNGIDVSRLSFSQDGDDLVILVDGDDTQSVRVLNHFLGGDAAISYVQPSGGSMITAEQIVAAIAGGGEEPVDPTDPVDPNDPTDPVDPGQGGDITPGLGGDDTLTGTAGNDVLLAGAGDDVLSGLAGNDRLFGGTGNDTYIYHSGQDLITELDGTDKLVFSNGITFNQVASGLTKSGNDLILKVNGSNENSVTLNNFFLGGDNLVENFEFETGGNISAAQIFGAFGLTMPGGTAPAVNAVHGTAGNDTLNGSAAADVLSGSHGNDTLNGAAGNDLLLGGRGNDTYVFSAGGGHDTIDNSGGGEDELLFEGISFNQVASGLMKSGNDLVLNIGGGSDKVTIKNWFLGGDYVVPTLRFAAGGQITANQIFGAFGLANPNPQGSLAYTDLPDERAFGNVFVGTAMDETVIGSSDDDFIDAGNGNDTLRGGAGNDYLLGGRGNDTYLFELGDGQDIINNYDPAPDKDDRLLFGAGISKEDVLYSRSGDSLLLQISGSSDSVTLHNWFNGTAHQLQSVGFVDGQIITGAEINASVSTEPAFFSVEAVSVQPSQFAMSQMTTSTSSQAIENDNGVVSSGFRDDLLQHQRTAPEQNAKSFLAKRLGTQGLFGAGFSRRAPFANHNDLPQSELAAEFKERVNTNPFYLREVPERNVTDMLLQRLTTSVADFSRPAALINNNDLPQSELARELSGIVSTNPPPLQRFKQAKSLLNYEVDAQHAGLIDALNAFDADSEAEFDGFTPAIMMSTEQYSNY